MQLEQWKKEVITKLASDLPQLQKGHSEAMEAYYQTMERERQIFECEIEALKKELKEVKGNKVESGRQNAKGKNKSLEKASEPVRG